MMTPLFLRPKAFCAPRRVKPLPNANSRGQRCETCAGAETDLLSILVHIGRPSVEVDTNTENSQQSSFHIFWRGMPVNFIRHIERETTVQPNSTEKCLMPKITVELFMEGAMPCSRQCQTFVARYHDSPTTTRAAADAFS